MDNETLKKHLVKFYESVSNNDVNSIVEVCHDILLYLKEYNNQWDWQIQGVLYHLLDRPGRNEYFDREPLEENEGFISISQLTADVPPGIVNLINENNISLPQSGWETIEELVWKYNEIKYDFYNGDAIGTLAKLVDFTPEAFKRNMQIEIDQKGNPISQELEENKKQMVNTAIKYVSILKPFMNSEDYKELYQKVKELVTNEKIPPIDRHIPVPVFSQGKKDNQSVVFLFSKIRDLMYSDNKKILCIDFIYQIFDDFDFERTTTEQKFTTAGNHIKEETFQNI